MPSADTTMVYQIIIEGKLHKRWADWFNEMCITYNNVYSAAPVTILQGPVADQSALRGLLIKLWDLNLTLVSVNRMSPLHNKEKNHG